MGKIENEIAISDNRILLYTESSETISKTYTLKETFLEKGTFKASYMLSQGEDYQFDAWVDGLSGSFEFNMQHPLYVLLSEFLGSEPAIVINSDIGDEEKLYGNQIVISREKDEIVLGFFAGPDFEDLGTNRIKVFIKNIALDNRSAVPDEIKARLLTLFDGIRATFRPNAITPEQRAIELKD